MTRSFAIAWFQGRRRRWLALGVLLTALVLAGLLAYWRRQQTEALLQLGQRALENREHAAARAHLERYLERRPQAAEARLLLVRAARLQRDFDAALQELRRCRADGGDVEAIDVEYALIKLRQGDDEPVRWLRQRAGQDDALALIVLEGLIQYDIDTYQLRQAQADLAAYLERRPDDLYALLARGYVWERFLSFTDALIDYRRAVEAHPDHDRARLRLADTLLIVGSPAEAEEQYRWLAQRWPRRAEVRLGLARCQHQQGNLTEAQALLDALLAETPDHGEALWERGQLALEQGRPAEAETWLKKAQALMPHDRRVSYSLERCCLALGRDEDALQHRQRVAQLDADLRRLDRLRDEVIQRPNDAALRCEGGLLFLRNGERTEGMRWLRIALRLDPNCQPARQALAEVQGRPGPVPQH